MQSLILLLLLPLLTLSLRPTVSQLAKQRDLLYEGIHGGEHFLNQFPLKTPLSMGTTEPCNRYECVRIDTDGNHLLCRNVDNSYSLSLSLSIMNRFIITRSNMHLSDLEAVVSCLIPKSSVEHNLLHIPVTIMEGTTESKEEEEIVSSSPQEEL